MGCLSYDRAVVWFSQRRMAAHCGESQGAQERGSRVERGLRGGAAGAGDLSTARRITSAAMGLLDVLRGGEAEARDDADANSDDEQPEREETGLFSGLIHAVDHLKEMVGVDDDDDEQPEASSSHQPSTQGVEVAAVVRAPHPGGCFYNLAQGKWEGCLHFTASLTTLIPPTRVWSHWLRL